MDNLNLYNGSGLRAQGSGLRAQGSGLRAQGSGRNYAQKLLSVIIPAYNTAKFLNKCVESVVNQTYKNIEIIIVDDGSSDSTPQICDEIANKYNNIKIIHQENKGLAQTRGVGFNASCGEYIAFIDSDDYIDLNAYETAIKVLEENEADMVEFGVYVINSDGTVIQELRWPSLIINSPENIFAHFMKTKDPTWSMCRKIFKRGMLKSIEWPKINMFEDYCISAQLFAKAQKFIFMPDIFYYYIQNLDSICHRPYSAAKINDIIKATEFVVNLTQQKFPEFLPEALSRRIQFCFGAVINLITGDRNDNNTIEMGKQLAKICFTDYKSIKQELKSQGRKLYIDNLSFTRKQRVQLWLAIHCPNLYKNYLKLRLKIHALTGI